MASTSICLNFQSQQQSIQGLRQAASAVYTSSSSDRRLSNEKTLTIASIRSCKIGQYGGGRGGRLLLLRGGSTTGGRTRFAAAGRLRTSSSSSFTCSAAMIREAQVVQVSNPAELLLEKWEKEPPVSSSPNPATESVNRLLQWDSLPRLEEMQTFSVYEINDLDRDSPPFLPFSILNVNSKQLKGKGFWGFVKTVKSTLSGAHEHGIGDIVPFSNKLYNGSLTMRLGITAGLTIVIKSYPGKGSAQDKTHPFFFPDRYETMYTFYMGDMGHISVQGPFVTFEDSLLTVTGGTGLFREARGVCRLHNLTPLKLFYTFQLKGIPEIPRHLTAKVVEPTVDVQPIPEAKKCECGFTLPHYSD